MQAPSLILLAALTALTALSCTRNNPAPSGTHQAPTITTIPISNISTTGATSGGVIISDDSAFVTARGVMWDTDSNFTKAQKANSGTGPGTFTTGLTGLSPATTYYARAFATNSGGTGYGNTVEFTSNYATSDYTVSTYANFTSTNDLPASVAVDPSGIVYAGIYSSGKIWKIATDGTTSILATILGSAVDLVTDTTGNLYVLARDQRKILKITPAGTVTTFAGGATGQVDGLGTAAGFSAPEDMDIDNTGNLYVTDDYSIRKVDPSGRVSTLYINRVSGPLFNGITVDKSHNVYFTDGYVITRMDTLGIQTYIAGKQGSADGTGHGAAFTGIYSLRMDKAGNLVAGDQGKIRMITPSGVVTTIAGMVTLGSKDGDGNIASFQRAVGLAIDKTGNIFVADDVNEKIRKIVHK